MSKLDKKDQVVVKVKYSRPKELILSRIEMKEAMDTLSWFTRQYTHELVARLSKDEE